ncbi:MAG: hypothetical protein M3081_03760 [Gemmatimonadota bacterium]|nr:hypothetical protein [Gemmatimonadota bacterium]
MSTPVGVVDFFVVEGTEYIERLDLLVSTAAVTGPDARMFLQYARSLRGSATMAKQFSIARVGAALEKVGRALRDGQLKWDPAINAVIISSVENLKILMRNVRSLTPADEERVQARLAELERIAPSGPRTPLPPATAGSPFLVTGAADLADAVDAFVAAPADREAISTLLAQSRAMRGVALVRDLPPLAEVVDVVERLAQSIDLGAAATTRHLSVVSAAAGVLRRASGELASGRRPDQASPEALRFVAAQTAFSAQPATEAPPATDDIVPVADLFFEDGGETIVHASPTPPTTPLERFRTEMAAHAARVRHAVNEARASRNAYDVDRLARELRTAMSAMQGAAESFGERSFAGFVSGWSQRIFAIDEAALAALDETAALLSDPATRTDELLSRMEHLDPTRETPKKDEPRARFATPVGARLKAILEEGIAGIDRLGGDPLSQPAVIPEEEIVPIESLLYRGPAAMERAREVREEMRLGSQPPSHDAVTELLELLDLAAVE